MASIVEKTIQILAIQKRNIHLVGRSSGMTLIEAEPAQQPRSGNDKSALSDWVRALEAPPWLAALEARGCVVYL